MIAGRKRKFRLTYDTLNKHVLKMEYAVRGQIPQEARRIEKAIKKARELRESERASILHDSKIMFRVIRGIHLTE